MPGRYKPYAEYRDSNIEWIGHIPEHWKASYLGFESSVKARLGWKGLKAEEYVDDGYVFLATPNIKDNEIDFINVNRITKERYDESPEIILEKGDILVTKDGSTTGTTNIIRALPEPATVNSSIAVLRSKGNVLSEYLYYFFVSEYIQNVISRMRGGMGVPHLFQADLRKFDILIPTEQEQSSIANFLDHETAKIDTLIEKQQQLIRLLKEKRQAVINHAVTKGLNPNAKMRDSGVEWLGEVPEHWALSQPRYACSFVGGGTPTKENLDFWGGDIPWVSPKDMKQDYLSSAQDTITSAALSHSAVKLIDTGAVLIVVRGMILDHSIPVALSEVKLTINQDMKALIPNSKLDGEYLLYCLKGMRDNILDLVESSAHGTKCLRTEQFDRMALPLPPLNEQLKIIAQLKDTLSRIDKLTSNTELMIGLAIERRTALISAAVTGKIDVRNWIAPQAKLIDKEVAA